MLDQEKTKEQLLIELNTLKEENRKLKKSRQHYQKDELKNQAVLNALPDILFHLDKNGIFLDYHAPKNDLLYSRPENFINEKITDILPKNIAVKTIDLTKEVLNTGKIMSFEYELPISNELRYFEARFTVFDENSVLILTRDITEKKALDKAHIESLEKFKSLTDNLNVGVYRTTAGAKGKFIEVNPAFLKMFGFDNKDEI
ncbi:MAG TPA: PAS domain-containing protein, partial [Candidatus Cloacimonetes bacterium]|nr:PAS domain-containing protein [Candidatus Cloacimonadota bacterium]